MEHESAEEAMHIMHGSPLGESQMEAHIESVMDMWLTLGLVITGEHKDAQKYSMVVVDTYPHEMLEVDGIIL